MSEFNPFQSLINPPAVIIGRTRKVRLLDSKPGRARAAYTRHGRTRRPAATSDAAERQALLAAMLAYKVEWMRKQRAARPLKGAALARKRERWALYMRVYRARKKAERAAAPESQA